MDAIIGKQFRGGKNLVDLEQILQARDYILLYFGAHWAPPCRLFTPTLAEFYQKINQHEKRIEVIFCSIDGNETAFERNFQDMPWFAIPYSDETRIQNLKQKFSITGIPTLVVMDKKGEEITKEGRLDIQNHQEGAFETWQKKQAAMHT